MIDPSEIFLQLESNDTEKIEIARNEIYGLFQNVKESWVVNGLFDYYINSNSLRSMEILSSVNEPHNKYLLDRLNDSVKRQETELRVKALQLFGHIVRRQPLWIYKLHEHSVMKEIFNLLKTEHDILVLTSALLIVIVLMPMIPSLIAHHLQDIFEVFSRLAAGNFGTGPQLDKQMMIHMQISLYALFLRLYGMYPCNFIAYLRSYYRDKRNPVFVHTIQPMLETVKMHPRLVTASKDHEVSNERWKTIGAQQVISECEQFYVDVVDKCPHDCCYVSTGFRSRSGTTNSKIFERPVLHLDSFKSSTYLPPQEGRSFFSPSFAFPDRVSVSTSPANIGPSRFIKVLTSHEGTSPPEAAIEATPETTPVTDTQIPASIRSPPIGSSIARGLTSFTKNRTPITTPTHSQPSSPMRKEAFPFNFPVSGTAKSTHQKIQRMLYERSQSLDSYQEPTPFTAVPASAKILPETFRGVESPTNKEDKEVEHLISQSRMIPTSPRKCDSVLHEEVTDHSIVHTLEEGSPCSQGGLHMPDTKSMNEFAKRVQRLRHHSQNYDRDPAEDSTSSSPGKVSYDSSSSSSAVKRTISCPEIKKKSQSVNKEKEESKKVEMQSHAEESIGQETLQKSLETRETQTDDYFLPYEHLFLNIFPFLENADVKSGSSQNLMPLKPFGEKESQHSVYNVLDNYIETSKGDLSNPSLHIQLLQQQLLFERYRRETFSARNRKLLTNAKTIKSLEEYNSALKDTIQLQQKDLEYLNSKISAINRNNFGEGQKFLDERKNLEGMILSLQDKISKLEAERDKEKFELVALREKYNDADNEKQQASRALFDAYAELNIAKEQAAMGEKARAEVERLNKEILLLAELQIKYQEYLAESGKTHLVNAELERLEAAYYEEVRFLKNKLDGTKSIVEAHQRRILDLEMAISQKDETISTLKRSLVEVNSENYEKLKAVESKYKTQHAINMALEQKTLQLYAKIDMPGLRNLHSPETSSCHEAIATASASGLSPHSSPLSVSLASSESSTAFLSSDIKDLKNLQILVDRKAGKSSDNPESTGDNMDISQPSTSGTQQ